MDNMEFVPLVNGMVGICVFMSLGYIYYILKMANQEMEDGRNGTTK